MKVLLLSPLSPTGGIASWTHNILEYINKNDIPYLVHMNTAVKFKKQTNQNLIVRLCSGCLDTSLLILKFLFTCFKHRPTVVHITSSASLALFKDIILLFILKFLSIKCIFHYRFGRIPELSEKKNWEWKLLSFIASKSYKIIVIDSSSYKTLTKEMKSSNNIVLIPNPCSQKVKTIAETNILSKEHGVYIFVGHVIKNKGVYELVQAFCEIPFNYKLIIVGPYERKVKEELLLIAEKKNKGEWISFIGNKEKKYIHNIMSIASALILPSYTEGFPNVVLEAMACGCPIIATDVGAISEMLNINSKDKSSGICIPPYSINDIKNAVLWLDANKENYIKFGLNGKQKVLENYTLEKIYPLYESLWK